MRLRTRSNELTAPVWLLLCVWSLILAAWLLQASVSSAVNRANEWKIVALDWAPWLLVTPGLIWICERWPIDQRSWRWTLPAHLVLSLVVSLSLGALAWRAVSVYGPPSMRPWGDAPPPDFDEPRPLLLDGKGPSFGEGKDFRGPPLPDRRAFPLMFVLTRGRGSVFFYWALLAVSHAVTYHRRSVARERQALAAEARLAEARLTALQAQLQPHFLFNTLNSISSMVYDKPAAADAMLCALSELLRRVLAASPHREVALSEEFALARSYVSIQQVRFGDALRVHWSMPEDLARAAVPTLLLQPLIENAVVHAVEENHGQSEIAVRAEKNGERLLLTVQDTGSSACRGLPQGATAGGKGTGIGLTNTRARLQELYGEQHRLEFSVVPGYGARVSIDIPYHLLKDAT